MPEALHQEVEEHSRWIAAHDVEEQAHRKAQALVNEQNTKTLDKIWEKIDTMQNKIAYFTGFAAFVGALVASIAAKMILN